MRHSSVLAVLIVAIALVPLTASATTSRSEPAPPGTGSADRPAGRRARAGADERTASSTRSRTEGYPEPRSRRLALHRAAKRSVRRPSRRAGMGTAASRSSRCRNGTLRLFAAGATHAGSNAFGINTFTAPAGGGSWQLQNGVFWGGAIANSAAYIGATLTRDGQPVTAWRGLARRGPPASDVARVPGSGMTASQLATDAGSGAVVLSGVTNARNGGVYRPAECCPARVHGLSSHCRSASTTGTRR